MKIPSTRANTNLYTVLYHSRCFNIPYMKSAVEYICFSQFIQLRLSILQLIINTTRRINKTELARYTAQLKLF